MESEIYPVGTNVVHRSGGPEMVVVNHNTEFWTKKKMVCCSRWIGSGHHAPDIKYIWLYECEIRKPIY